MLETRNIGSNTAWRQGASIRCATRRVLFGSEAIVSLFWLAYCLQSTVFVHQLQIEGLFYPIYVFMVVGTCVAVLTQPHGLQKVPIGFLTTYFVFYLLVVSSLIYGSVALDFLVMQRLLIYLLGILVYFQFTDREELHQLPTIQGASALLVAIWVLWTAKESGYAYRGGIEINQNYLSTFIGIGAIAILNSVIGNRQWKWINAPINLLLISMLSVCVYSMMILASRGLFIALAASLIVLFWLQSHKVVQFLLFVALAAVAGLVMANSVAGLGLIYRLTAEDFGGLGSRALIWTAGLHKLESASALQLFFGQGLFASEHIVSETLAGISSMHNTYLEILVEFGLFGFFLFVILHFLIAIRLLRRRDSISKLVIATLAFMLVANLSGSVADNFLYWIVVGHAAAVAYRPSTILPTRITV